MKISDKALLDMMQERPTSESKTYIRKIFCHSESKLNEFDACGSCKDKCENYYTLKEIYNGR